MAKILIALLRYCVIALVFIAKAGEKGERGRKFIVAKNGAKILRKKCKFLEAVGTYCHKLMKDVLCHSYQ